MREGPKVPSHFARRANLEGSDMNSIVKSAMAALSLAAASPASAKSEVVEIDLGYPAGSVVIVNGERRLYYVTGNGRAVRYGVAVGKSDELWMGRTFVVDKKVDPRWVPVDGSDPVDGGDDDNPLGKRALYLDWSLLRIHGTPSRGSIGRAVSNGCIRMLNEDVIDLFDRVHLGAPVFAISSRDEKGWYQDAKVSSREFANPDAREAKEAAAAAEAKAKAKANK
jgi:lipoprotein-anchoring transpeptidase ErfK/SrfK